MMLRKALFFLITLLKLYYVLSVELTFELYDNAKDCFYEVIERNITTTLEYQVNRLLPNMINSDKKLELYAYRFLILCCILYYYCG